VAVDDDGIGLPDKARPGVGLVSMRERAEELGGALRIERRPEGGTRVIARLPLSA
jgi:two-component system sensor histidine kinase UhpB